MEEHRKRVDLLAEKIKDFYRVKQPFRVYHGSTNSTRTQTFKQHQTLDTSGLDHILNIDPVAQTVLTEPNVPMDKLVHATLKYGLVPPIVMEFPGITVGGGIQGGAAESGSFHWGYFHKTCISYEILVGDGSKVMCSSDENPDLFYGTVGSYGTLGIITAVTIQLVPAKKYVSLEYTPISSAEEMTDSVAAVGANEYDFVDGIMFGRQHGVMMTGKMSDDNISPIVRFSRAKDNWFYLHVQEIDQKGKSHVETMPLVDYLFRYDRGGFWVGKYAFDLLGVPFTRFWRYVLDRMLHTRKMYEAIQQSNASQKYIVQDLAMPQQNAVKMMEFIDKNLDIYPLWVCPILPDPHTRMLNPNIPSDLIINIGVWGGWYDNYDHFVATNIKLEKIVAKLNGKKWLYAHTYYSEKDFWKIYDKPSYDSLRKKYNTDYLPTLYEKVKVGQQYPLRIKSGVFKPLLNLFSLKIE